MPVTPEAMAALRLRGDELADATVEALFAGGEVGHFNTLMRWFERSGDPLPEGLPQAAHDYLAATAAPPDWVDWDVMETARMFFIDNNVHISTALSFASMPACYMLPHVARLLAATHALDYPSNRMAATGQFTVYLMRPGRLRGRRLRSSRPRRRSACCTPRSGTICAARARGTRRRGACRSARRT